MDAFTLDRVRAAPDDSPAEMIRSVVVDGTDEVVATIARYRDSWGRFYVWQRGTEVPAVDASEPHTSWLGAFGVVNRWVVR